MAADLENTPLADVIDIEEVKEKIRAVFRRARARPIRGDLLMLYDDAASRGIAPRTEHVPHRVVYGALIKAGSQWVAGSQDWNCPAHDDTNASFGVMPDPGNEHSVVMTCQAGCSFDDVLSSLGLARSDLDESRYSQVVAPTNPPRPAPTYLNVEKAVWVTAEGVPSYMEVRHNDGSGKRYMRRLGPDGRPLPRPRKGREMAGVDLVLSDLPAVLETAASGGEIWVCEGPHAVYAALAAGLAATTLPYGATAKWALEHTQALRGCSLVTVWADRDQRGYAYALSVVRALSTAGVPVRAVQSRTTGAKDDAVEHFCAGFAPQQVEELSLAALESAAAGQTEPSQSGTGYQLTRASEVKAVKSTWAWTTGDGDKLLPEGELSLLAGREGVGKSLLAAQLLADVTRGRLAGALFGRPSNVIVVAPEDSFEATVKPRLAAADADMDRIYTVRINLAAGATGTRELKLTSSDLEKLRDAIRQTDARFLVLDPIISRLSGSQDTYKDAEVRSELEPLVEVAHDTRCTMLGLIHFNKAASSDVLNLIMGSRAFAAVARAVLVVVRDPDDPSTVLLGQPKSNLGRTMESVPRCLTYRIDEVEVSVDDIVATAPHLKWGDPTTRAVRDVAAAAVRAANAAKATSGESKKALCAQWLVRTLRDRPDHAAPLKLLKKLYQDEGFTQSNFYAARGELEEGGWLTIERAQDVHGEATYQLTKLAADDGRFTFELSGVG